MVSDSELISRLRELLRNSDLNTTTTAIVRRKLEEDFSIDLSDKKKFIREQVDLFLHTEHQRLDEEDGGDCDEVDQEDGDDNSKMEEEDGDSGDGDNYDDDDRKSKTGWVWLMEFCDCKYNGFQFSVGFCLVNNSKVRFLSWE